MTEPEQSENKQSAVLVRIVSTVGNVNIRCGNGLEYSRITSAQPGTLLLGVAAAANGWHAVKIGKQVGWVSPEFSEFLVSASCNLW